MSNQKIDFEIGDTLTDQQAMQFAIDLAAKGVGFVSPNPPVGCVILDSKKQLVGFGYHEAFGGAHAEVNAIATVADKSLLKGATFYITLEPCSHTGKTPPCTEAILASEAAKVVYAFDDPNPLVAGKGLNKLTQAGVSIEKCILIGDQAKRLDRIMESFLYNMSEGKAFVTLKVATSLDGYIAKDSGESQWITGEEARRHVHQLRGEHDAILVGRGTVEEDDPKLNIRYSKFKGKELWVVILDPQLKVLKSKKKYKIFDEHKRERIIFVHDAQITSVENDGFNCLPINFETKAGFALEQLWKDLFEKFQVGSLMVEGGAQTHSQMLKNQYYQRLSIYMGAKLIGADHSVSWTKGLDFHELSDSIALEITAVQTLGGDVLISAKKS